MQRVGFDEGIGCHGTKFGQGGWKYMLRLTNCLWHLIGPVSRVSRLSNEGEKIPKECLRKLHPLCHVQMAKTADAKVGHGAGQLSRFARSH